MARPGWSGYGAPCVRRQTVSLYLGNTRFFDCVIEPGEYAAERDTGPTVRLRHEVVQVPPIRLLDDGELLSRDTRAQRDGPRPRPARRAGAARIGREPGHRRPHRPDGVADSRRFDGLQIVIAEWSNGAIRCRTGRARGGCKRLPDQPLFAAFDFSVSAAGYNTFHEVIAQGLPTIFVANRHPSMDDQGARAEFAQDHGAGFDLKEEEMHLFPTLCRAMLNPEANAVLREGCAAFDLTNGAAEAAAIIIEPWRGRGMSGWTRRKKGPAAVPDPHRDAPFYRIAEIYERAWAEDGVDDTIHLTWDARGRTPAASRRSLPLPPDLAPYWPARSAPTRPLSARRATGRILGTLHGALFVTLFGLTGERS
jgi:hypothetical protein